MNNDKTYTLEVTKRELEVLIRGCRRMAKDYKYHFANADTPECEQTFLWRFQTADTLIKTIDVMLNEIVAEENAPITSDAPELKWKVYMVSEGGTKIFFNEFATEEEAVFFCESKEWSYEVEGFVWGLVIEEDD